MVGEPVVGVHIILLFKFKIFLIQIVRILALSGYLDTKLKTIIKIDNYLKLFI